MQNPQVAFTMNVTEPVWYKQFWPWFLIILPGIVVIASLVTVFIAFKGADDLVADNYYKEGMAINKTVSDLNTAKAKNLKGTLRFTENAIELAINANEPVEDDALLILFSHPLDDSQDQSIHLHKIGSGKYVGQLPVLDTGKWYINLQSLQQGNPWRINVTVLLPADHIDIHAK